MKLVTLIPIFFLVLLIIDNSEAFLSAIVKGISSLFGKRRRRDLEDLYENFNDFDRRDNDLADLLRQMPLY